MYHRRRKIDTMWLKRNDAKRFICMIITIVISVYPMSLSPVWNGKIPGHRDQYERMAQSMLIQDYLKWKIPMIHRQGKN